MTSGRAGANVYVNYGNFDESVLSVHPPGRHKPVYYKVFSQPGANAYVN